MRPVSRAPLALLSCLTACGPAAPSPPSTPERSEPDKRALYGDAGLIPTREGERARRELALAGEIHAGLELLDLGPAHVDVELQGPAPSAVVVAQVGPEADLASLEITIAELAAATVPGLERADVHVWLSPRPAPAAPPTNRPWGLALTCLGLGLSLGVTLERLRGRTKPP